MDAGALEFIAALEAHFQISFPEEELEKTRRFGDLLELMGRLLDAEERIPAFWEGLIATSTTYFREISFEAQEVHPQNPLHHFLPIPCGRDIIRELGNRLHLDIPPFTRQDRRWLESGIWPGPKRHGFLRCSLHAYGMAIAAYNFRQWKAESQPPSRLFLEIQMRGILHEELGANLFDIHKDADLNANWIAI